MANRLANLSKNRKAIISVLFCLLLVLSIFPKQILMKAIQYKMKGFGSFSCKDWGFQGGYLVLKDLNILNSDNCKIKIGRAQIKEKNYYLEDVDLNMKGKIDFSKFLENSNANIFVRNGLLCLDDETIPWKLSKEGKRAIVTLFFNTQPVQIEFCELKMTTSFPMISTHFLKNLVRSYFDWEILDGSVGGQNLTFDFVEKKFSGQLTCHQIKGRDEKLFLNLSLEQGEIDFSKNDLSFSFRNLFFSVIDHENIYLNLPNGTLALHEGKIEPTVLAGSLLGIQGNFSFGPNEIAIDFEGDSLYQFFPGDFISLHSKILRNEAGFDVNGKLCIGHNGLDFGGHLGQSQVGWFRGEGFSLEKFLSPFLLNRTKLNLTGALDFEGSIAPDGLTIYYLGKDLCLENEQFCLKCPCIGPELKGFHFLDFKEKKSFGNFELKNATYIQKNFGFALEKANAAVFFQDQNIEIKAIKTKFEDLDLKGNLFLTFHENKPPSLLIEGQEFAGSISSAKNLLDHFVPSFIWAVPLEGKVSSEKGGFFFSFSLDQKTELIEAQICGHLKSHFQSKFFSLNDYSVFFDYDKKRNQIILDEGIGLFSCRGKEYKIKTKKFDFPPHGLPQVELDILAERGEEIYNIIGKMQGNFITLGGNLFDLKGEIDQGLLCIEHFQCKGFQGNASVDFASNVSSVEVISQELGQIKFEGTFDQNVIDGDLFFGDLCLSHVLKNYEKLWNPKGKITGKAKFHWDLQDENFELSATADFESLSVAGIEFGKGANLQCNLSSEHGLIVEGLEVNMDDDIGCYKLGKLHYKQESQKIKFDELDFTLPKEKMVLVTSFLKKLMPDKMTDEMISWIVGLKQEGELEGKVSMEIYPDRIWAHLALEDGLYFFQGKEHKVANFLLTMTSNRVEVNTDYFLKGVPFFLSFQSDSLFTKGILEIKKNRACKENLLATWKKTTHFHIEEIKGKLLGLRIDLTENQESVLESRVAFRGKVEVDFSECIPFFSLHLAMMIEKWGLGAGYSFEGDFIFSPHDVTNLMFSGHLIGLHFEAFHLCLNRLKAEVLYTNKLLEVKNLTIEDCESQLKCPLVEFKELNREWLFSMGKLSLTQFRLSKLKGEIQKERKGFFKPTTIHSLELCDFKGILGKKESFEGYGEVEFSHVSRKNFFSTLLYLPSEITARLGLDLNLLVPSRGKIRYKIKNARVNLTQFRSMYSEGKRSRFYLAEGQPAYIDFDGNVNVKIKMKQYNLLMKVAEFFVISVKGNIKQPQISFANLFGGNYDEQ